MGIVFIIDLIFWLLKINMDSYNKDNLDLIKMAAGKNLGALISSKNLEKIVTKIYLNMQSQVE